MFKTAFFSCLMVGAFALGSPLAARAAEPTDFLFVGDLKTGTLLRYGVSSIGGSLALTPYGLNGNLNDAAYIVGQGVTEGVHGTGNTLITSQHVGNTWYISRFDRFTGAFINHVSAQTFGGIGNIALTNDAKTVYVPDESGNKLYRIDVATGTVLSSVTMAGVHDIQIGADGFIYAAAYSRNSGVIRFSADLSTSTTIVAPATTSELASPGPTTLYRPAGMVVTGSTLYINQNILGTGASVFKYDLNGGSPATFNAKVSSPLLAFTFGMEQGPDGNLYIAVPGTYPGANGSDLIAKVTVANIFSNSTVSTALTYPGTVNSTTYTSDDTNIIQPKYIKFSQNFAQANDPGVAPEPGSIALFLTAGLPLAGLVARRRRKNRA